MRARTQLALGVALCLIASCAVPSMAWAAAVIFGHNWRAARAACAANKPLAPVPGQGQGNVGPDVTVALAFGCTDGRDRAAALQKQIPGPPTGFSYNSQLYHDGFESGWYASWFRQGPTVPPPIDLEDFVLGWRSCSLRVRFLREGVR